MQFGVFFQFKNDAHDLRTHELYLRTLEDVCIVEELGYDFVFVSEHHFVGEGCMPSPLTMLAAFAARTSRIHLGTNILVLPLYDPLRVAEEAAVVDQLSGGRLVLGVASGYKPEEFEAYEVDRTRRARALEQGINLIRSAWLGHGRDSDRPARLREVEVVPKPTRSTPIWIGGYAAPAVDRAVRMGDGYMMGGAGAMSSDAPYRFYVEALERHRRGTNSVPLIGNRNVYVSLSDRQAWEEVGPGLVRRNNVSSSWFANAGQHPKDMVLAEVTGPRL